MHTFLYTYLQSYILTLINAYTSVYTCTFTFLYTYYIHTYILAGTFYQTSIWWRWVPSTVAYLMINFLCHTFMDSFRISTVERLKIPRDTIVSYWKPEVAVKLVTDFTNYTEDSSTLYAHTYIHTVHTYSTYIHYILVWFALTHSLTPHAISYYLHTYKHSYLHTYIHT